MPIIGDRIHYIPPVSVRYDGGSKHTSCLHIQPNDVDKLSVCAGIGAVCTCLYFIVNAEIWLINLHVVFGAAAAAAVAQAAATVRDSRAPRLGLATPTAAPAVEALDGPIVMAPSSAPDAEPGMGMAPGSALGMEMAPMTAPGMAEAPAVMADQGPAMMAPAMAPGLFHAFPNCFCLSCCHANKWHCLSSYEMLGGCAMTPQHKPSL